MSNNQYINAQRRLLNLFENGHNMTLDQLERALDGLVGNARQMVRTSRIERLPVARPQSPIGPPPLRLAPVFVDIRTPDASPERSRTPPGPPPHIRIFPAAELRPRATGPVRPSVLIQQMRASSAATAATLARLEEPVRLPVPWNVYVSNHIQIRAIGKARFEAKCAAPCGICLETHTNGESTVTVECNHCFGQNCWKTWISNQSGNQSCPECRTPCPKTIVYKQRAERKSKKEKEEKLPQARSAGLHD
jgi:hypothetical protein